MKFWYLLHVYHARIQRRDRGSDPLENHKNIGVLINTDPRSPKNHKATKSAFNDGSSLARQRNAIKMAFRRRADDDPLIMVFGSFLPHQTKKKQYHL